MPWLRLARYLANTNTLIIPAKAGIHFQAVEIKMDPGFCRDDGLKQVPFDSDPVDRNAQQKPGSSGRWHHSPRGDGKSLEELLAPVLDAGRRFLAIRATSLTRTKSRAPALSNQAVRRSVVQRQPRDKEFNPKFLRLRLQGADKHRADARVAKLFFDVHASEPR